MHWGCALFGVCSIGNNKWLYCEEEMRLGAVWVKSGCLKRLWLPRANVVCKVRANQADALSAPLLVLDRGLRTSLIQFNDS